MIEDVKKEAISGPLGDERHTHPAFAMIGASRVQSTGYPLNGSDFMHGNFIVLKINRSEMTRGLSQDRHFAKQTLVEVALSEAQWATMISSLNIGDGVPCTLQWIQGEGQVPQLPKPRGESKEFVNDIRQTVQASIDELTAVMEENPRLPKKVLHRLKMARQGLQSNIPYVVRTFGEHAEDTVEKAKTEIEAYMHGRIQRAGLEALGGSVDPIMLPAPEED